MDVEEGIPTTKTLLRCTNVPLKLLEKKTAKEYFHQFGRITRLCLKAKNRVCTVQYDSHESAELAMVNAGLYEGETFTVMLDTKKKRPKKEVDPDWSFDPEVKAELEAMGDEFYVKRKYNLRPEGMAIDSESPPAMKKERKIKRCRKSEKPVIAVSKPTSAVSIDKQELLNKLKQSAVTVEEKFRMLDVRDKLIRLMRVQKQVDILKTKHTVGTCPDMCPEKERLMREVQHQVALYEQESSERTMNHSLAVKQYSRSSADQEAPLPHELRNVDVLQMAMGYLMHRIMNLCDSPETNLAEWYHFLWDRTRGIRKDITQQELCCQGSVELVEQCARFHIHCSARLVAEDSSVFDQKINTENLTKCLQTLKYMYHDLALKGEQCPQEQEFRAYIILLNLNDGNFMWEVQQLKPEIQKSKEIKFALDVYSALDKNNYVKFFKLVQTTTYLNACILLRYFIQVRTRALSTILKCYAPRAPHTQFPLQEFNKILAFEGITASIDFLEYFGLSMNEEQTHVILDKRQYSLPDYPYILDRAINVIESKRKTSVGEIVCGKPLPAPIFIQHVVQSSFDEDGFLDVSEFTVEFVNETEPAKEIIELKPAVPPHIFKERSNSPLMMDTGDQNKQAWLKKPETSVSIFAKSDTGVKALDVSNEPSKIFSSIANQINKSKPSPFAPVIPPIFPTINVQKPEAPQKKVGGFQFDLLKSKTDDSHKIQEEKREEERRRKEKEIETQREKEMQYMVELARKKQEKQKLEEEHKRQMENKRRELQQLERMRKLEELKKEEQKIREERRKLEEQMVEHMQIKTAVRTLMDEMLLEVEEDYKNHRLKCLKEVTIKRHVIARWKKKIAINKRKRKAIDQSPVWLSSKSSKETASELYSRAQDVTLILRKRYKQGLSRNVLPKTMGEIKSIDLVALTGKTLIQNLNQVHNQTHVYWKINVSIAEAGEMKICELVENTLDNYVGWKENILLEQHPFESNKITYCLQKLDSKEMDKEADGFIFISNKLSDSLLRRIYQLINRLEEYVTVPITLILQEYPEDTSKLDELVDKGLISNYEIQSGPFNQLKCLEYFNEALTFLSENVKRKQLLELNTLRSFLMQLLGTELWQRISSFAKWNCAYKQCLTVPNVAISLYNEAVEFMKETAFSQECYKYANFPSIFRDFLDSKVPDSLPCDYKYFPSFWRNPRYGKHVLSIIDSLTLPKFQSTWPPTNQATLEKLIHNYCSKIFDKPERPFYKVMSSILRNGLDTILWTNVIETIALEKIDEINFDLMDKTFSSNTVFNQLFVVYESTMVNKYCRDPWFYLTNPAVQEELDESLNEPETEVRVSDDDYEIDLEKTFEEVPEIAKYKSQLSDIHTLMEDLEESMAVQKEINRKFQSSLQKVLEDI